eukprot:9266618-Pyramimonas_sp.AAC.1
MCNGSDVVALPGPVNLCVLPGGRERQHGGEGPASRGGDQGDGGDGAGKGGAGPPPHREHRHEQRVLALAHHLPARGRADAPGAGPFA